MIEQIKDLPTTMVGFRAIGEITKNDFVESVMPAVQELIDRTGKLNYLLVLDTELKNFTIESWIEDALMGIKHLFKWNRAAIVSDQHGIRIFTELFSKIMPGEFKGFEHKDLQAAIDWTAGERALNS